MWTLEEMEELWLEYGEYVIIATKITVMIICAIGAALGIIVTPILCVMASLWYVLLLIPTILLLALLIWLIEKIV